MPRILRARPRRSVGVGARSLGAALLRDGRAHPRRHGDHGRQHQANELAYAIAKTISKTGSLVFINDRQGHDAVLALFDDALAAA